MVVPDRITADHLNHLLADGDVWDLNDYVYAFVKENDGFTNDEGKNRAILERLPNGLQMIWHICGIQFEVPNGGFWQFFENSTGCHAVDTLHALRNIGDTGRADLLERAMELIHAEEGRPLDYRERWFGEPIENSGMGELDQAYWKLDEESDILDGLMRAYMQAHLEEFVHPADSSPLTVYDPD